MSENNVSINPEKTTQLSRMYASIGQRLLLQREKLRQARMDLPPGALKTIEALQADMEKLGPMINEQNNELERLRTIANTTSLINSSLDIEEVLGSVMETVLELTGAERGYLMLRNDETDEMEVRVASGGMEGDELVVSRTIVQQVLDNGEPIVTTNAQSDDRFAGQHSVIGYNLRSILCVPLTIKGHVEGVVYADNSIHDGLFDKKELQLLSAIASQSALAIENAKLFAQARQALEEITAFKTLQDNILASIVSGVVTTDADDNVTTFNPSAEQIFQREANDAFGRPINTAIPELSGQVDDALTQARFEQHALTLETETEIQNRQRHLALKISPLKDAADDVQGVALVIDDLTELKQRSAQLEAVNRYLPPAMVQNIQSIENIGLGGVRREVTVLFADVRSINTFPAQMQARDVMETLNLYFTAGTEAIHRHKGLIDKYMASDIMALFNTQLNPSDDHAWAAVLSALDIAHDFHALYEQIGEIPDVPFYRIGIHTGIATLGNVGGSTRREFTAIGDTINLAKRLEENASFGEIILSRSAYDACGERLHQLEGIEIVPREALQVKGRQQQTEIFQLRFLN